MDDWDDYYREWKKNEEKRKLMDDFLGRGSKKRFHFRGPYRIGPDGVKKCSTGVPVPDDGPDGREHYKHWEQSMRKYR